ncbi:GumC family protein [Parerythrobacter jejuensis]|uniref:Polysaccharide biosynthesis tyrosine autokinase n=1 Tax=Parerythrobacter jejuensis TaxID=795812 RepID=A0A845ANY9_9SPHN|nr:polysaccharide biosynthesis tyrosine autokinase [Parerythrobacter jejuensis]MXP30893.1 polysaccharide biosynthesis tyrosine autokinase [Parerythrobacter jejuensis]MXP33653.1 polysaccharide biosynthesis tyrosine autokinase [Parerythrobacter jejuensis]
MSQNARSEAESTQFEADPALLTADPQGAALGPALLHYWNILKRRRFVIAGVVVGAIMMGLVATLLMPKQYTAISRIEIDREKREISTGDGLESSDASRDLEFYQTQYSLLESRSLAMRVSKKLKLAANERFFDTHGAAPEDGNDFATANIALSAADRAEREKQVVELLLDHLSIRPLRGSALIDVAYRSTSPEISASIANAWVEEYIQSNLDRRYSSASSAREFLEERLQTLRVRLEESERNIVNYAANNDIITVVGSSDGTVEGERTLLASNLEALNQALVGAIAERVRAESRAKEASSSLSAELLANTSIGTLRQRRAELSAEVERLKTQFEEGYPALEASQQQLRELDRSIAQEEARVRNIRSSARADEYREALRRENDLRQRVTDLKLELESQRRAGIQYNIYRRDVDTSRELYNGLLQRFKEIGAAGVGLNNISIVDRAEVPDEPSSPNLPINMALALLAGLILSGGLVFALEQIDEGLESPRDVANLLGQTLLGGVPRVADFTLADLQDPKSELSEAYTTIWSNLAFSSPRGLPRSLVFTSTKPNEGKTISSTALALIIARAGKRVLLVDGDLRSPSVHLFVGTSNERGYANYLAGDDDWRGLVQDSSFKNLSVISTGPKPPNPAELLSSDRTKQLIDSLSSEYDLVIIDAPPVLGLADAPLLAREVEGCVFVSEVAGAPAREINASINRLHAVQVNVLGVVLTKIDEQAHGYGYGYGYGYGNSGDQDL